MASTPGPDVCTSSAIEWAGLIITIVSLNVAWWLCDIPLLWKYGVKEYFNSVTWQCFRLYMPAVVAVLALAVGRTSEERAYVYYIGPFSEAMARERHFTSPLSLSRFQFIKALGIDLTSIVATVIAVYNGIRAPVDTGMLGFNSTLWSYPSLPVATIGLWFLVASLARLKAPATFYLGILVVAAVGAAVIVPIALVSPAAKEGMLWILGLVGYCYLAIPFAAARSIWMVIACVFGGFFFRIGGIGVSALGGERTYFPFCELKGKPFGIVYLVVGGIGALLAIFGRLRYFGSNNWSRLFGISPTPGEQQVQLQSSEVRHVPDQRQRKGMRQVVY